MSRPLSRRFWLVSISVAAHLAVGIGMFATGVWRLDRLESDRRIGPIAFFSPPAPSGGPEALPEQKLNPKEKKVEVKPEKAQWDPTDRREETAETTTALDATGNGKGDKTGDGENPDGDPDDRGTCVLPPCGPKDTPIAKIAPPVEVPKVVQAKLVDPTVIRYLRISGNTQIHPSNRVKHQMRDAAKDSAAGAVKVCLDERGAISSVRLMVSTKYPEYDDTLVAAVRTWRYRPHTVGGVGVPVCGMVSFHYTMK